MAGSGRVLGAERVVTAHPVAAAIDGLLAVWSGAPELRYTADGQLVNLYVVDGLPIVDLDAPRALFVGVGALLGSGPAASAAPSYGPARRSEQFDVGCELHVWSGDSGPGALAAVRTTAFAVLDTLAALLDTNRDLGGVVDWARIGRSTYQPSQHNDGVEAVIEIAVRVDATRMNGA